MEDQFSGLRRLGPDGHLPPVIVSVALAMADATDAPGAELLAALVAGLEIAGRVGAAMRRPGMGGHRPVTAVRGHPHAAFAAVAAAGCYG